MARGVPPPPRGSPKEALLVAYDQRERLIRLAEWEMGIHATGVFMGAKSEALSSVVSSLRAELSRYLHHEVFDAQEMVRRLEKKLVEMRRTSTIIDKVEKMSDFSPT